VGLFSFVGKAIKGIGKVVGGAVKIAAGAAKLGLIPGGGLLGSVAGRLLASKQPMSSTAVKLAMRSPQIMRGNATQAGHSSAYNSPYGYRPPPAVLRLSPVMPGGAVATPSGIAPRSSAPPGTFSGGYGGAKKKRTKKRKATTKRRTTRGRKLKFGSPAWRKKYMKKRRRAA